MTKRDFYVAIANADVPVEIKEYAVAAIEALDAKAAEKRAEKIAEKAPIREAILAVITEEPKTATTLIAEAGVEITPQAIPGLLKGDVEAGVIAKVDIKVPKKGTQKGYKTV